MSDAQWAGHLFAADPMESAARRAATLGTIGSAAKDAGLNASFQIRGVVGGHFREKTVVGIFRRIQECLRDAVVHQELRKLLGQEGQFRGYLFAVVGREHLRASLADLRRVQTYPDAVDLGPLIPERYVFFEVAGALEHRPGDHPMHVDFASPNVFQDAVVGGRLSAYVVVLGRPSTETVTR